jgi:hypothetical protein
MGTSMQVNRTFGSSGSQIESLARLIEKEINITLSSNENLYIPVDVGFDRFEVRTVFVENADFVPYVLSMYDKKEDGNIIYRSLEETATYDIANVPCEDKDGLKTLHMYLQNKSTTQTTFRLIIRLTNFL